MNEAVDSSRMDRKVTEDMDRIAMPFTFIWTEEQALRSTP